MLKRPLALLMLAALWLTPSVLRAAAPWPDARWKIDTDEVTLRDGRPRSDDPEPPRKNKKGAHAAYLDEQLGVLRSDPVVSHVAIAPCLGRHAVLRGLKRSEREAWLRKNVRVRREGDAVVVSCTSGSPYERLVVACCVAETYVWLGHMTVRIHAHMTESAAARAKKMRALAAERQAKILDRMTDERHSAAQRAINELLRKADSYETAAAKPAPAPPLVIGTGLRGR
jgi:hypothetical protein